MNARYILPLLFLAAVSVARAAESGASASTSTHAKTAEHKTIKHHATKHHSVRHHAARHHAARRHSTKYRAAARERRRSTSASARHAHHKLKKGSPKYASHAHASHRKRRHAARDVIKGRNPIIEAIDLVATRQRTAIRAADRKVSESNWWSDTLQREWIVRRPFGPGIFDSTHWFYVSYKVNGRILMSWFVDVRKHTVSDVAPPENQNRH